MPPSTQTPSLSIVFVCQAGELELKGALLAASLRRHGLPPAVDLVAAIPDESLWGPIPDSTLALLAALDVRVEPIDSPFGRDYPTGNKIAALGVRTDASVTAFVDSDVLCLRPIDEGALETSGLLAKPADFKTFGNDPNEWRQVYELFDLEPPSSTVVATISGETMSPYFNAGVVAARDGPAFAARWLEVARAIDAEPGISNKRPWLDQIALPVAARLLDYPIQPMSEALNFPAHERCLDERRLPALCHYHWPDIVEQERVLSRQVDELAARHAPIRRLLGRYPAWNGVLKRAGRFRSSGRSSAPEARRRDFLVTGLPWSGSDVLCNLLNRAPDTVVVNDPEEISWALEGDAVARRLPLLYRMLRTGVVLEWGTKNRLNERGEILEDSAGTGYVSYVPRVASEDFSLGTRNRLAYLTRLTSLCDELPELGRIATIRHPLATIAAWKEIARHLDTSYVDELVLLADATPLDELQRQAVERIRSEPAPAAKRAVLWALLAELVWRDRDKLLAIRFEDLLADPSGEFDRVSAYLDGARPGRAVRGPAATAPGLVIEDDETDLILSICRESMAKWEYD